MPLLSVTVDTYIFGRPRWLSQMLVRLVIRRSQVRSNLVRHHSFVEVDHEIFSTVISSVSLIQEGQLSVSDERIRTSAGYNVTAWRTKPAQEKCV